MSSYLDTTKPESDVDSQLDSQLNSQLIVARGPSRSASIPISTVLALPSHLISMRQLAFALDAPINWTADNYASYWPFMDNIWVHNHTERITKKRTQKSYWFCRLWKQDADIKSQGSGRRAKRMRLADACSMKLAMIKQFDEINELLAVTLSCHVNKKLDDSVNQLQHNHILEAVDNIKINSAIGRRQSKHAGY